MTADNSWMIFFEQHAPEYMDNCFVANTDFEVDFIEEELKLPSGAAILDVGCGTGRHSLELARRGYRVTGIDLSDKMLEEAREIARTEELKVEFIQADATEFNLDRIFDGCICICEGAFGLLSMGEDPFQRDLRILKNVSQVLKPGALFLLTALNGMKMIRQYQEKDVEEGRFDPVAVVETTPLSEMLEEGPEDIYVREKGFLATELKLMLEKAGFQLENIWGGAAGNWKRERLRLDEMEIMAVSQKLK